MARRTSTSQQLRDDPEAVVHHKRRKRNRDDSGKMTLNLTAMIDVVFQLLIYFVVTASFAIDEGMLTTQLPTGSGTGDSADPPKKPLNIIVRSEGTAGYRVSVQGFPDAPVNFKQLSEMLKGLMRDPERNLTGPYPSDNPVIIRPDGLVRWTHVVNAYNAALRAGYKQISFAKAG